MATWHQQKGMARWTAENPGHVHPLYAPHATQWKCVSTAGFSGAITFGTEKEARDYAARTGDTVIPPRGD